MKNLLWVLILALSAHAVDTTLTWSSTSNTVFLAVENWTSVPAGATEVTGPNKILRFIDSSGITEAVPAAPASDISVKSITMTANPYNITFVARRVTVETGYKADPGGTLNMGIALTITGSGQIHINPTSTLTASTCSLFVNGAVDTFDNDKANATYNNIRIAASCAFLSTGGGAVIFRSTVAASAPLIIGDNAAATLNGSSNTNFQPITVSDTAIRIGSGVTFNGTAPILIGTNIANLVITIPAIDYSGTGDWSIITTTGVNGDTFNIIGNIDLKRNTFNWKTASATSTGVLYNNPTSNVSCGAWNIGTGNAANSVKFQLGTGTYDVVGATFTSTGTDSTLFQSSIIKCSDGVTFAAPGVGDFLDPGTSKWIFDSTTNSLIKTQNHTSAIYDAYSRKGGAAICTLGDSLTGHTWTGDSGSLKFGSKNMKLSGDFVLQGRQQDTAFARMVANQLTFTNSAIFKVATQYTRTDSLNVNPWDNLYFNIDKDVAVRRVTPADGKKITVSAGQTLTLAKNTVRDFTGTTAAPCSLVSSSAGNRAYVENTVQPEDSGLFAKDMGARGLIWYDTIQDSRLVNGLNDSNFMFKSMMAGNDTALYLTPSQPTLTTVSPITGTTGTACSLTVATELFAPCSLSVDGGTTYYAITVIDSTQGYLSMPAGAGPVNFTVKNADGLTTTKNGAFTYPGAAGGTHKRRGVGLGLGLSYLDGAFRHRAWR